MRKKLRDTRATKENAMDGSSIKPVLKLEWDIKVNVNHVVTVHWTWLVIYYLHYTPEMQYNFIKSKGKGYKFQSSRHFQYSVRFRISEFICTSTMYIYIRLLKIYRLRFNGSGHWFVRCLLTKPWTKLMFNYKRCT